MEFAQKIERPAATGSRTRNVALWIAQVLLAVGAGGAGLSKLLGAPEMVAMFETIGVGQWFRIATGVIEIGGAVLLLVPALAGVGGLVLGSVLTGAVVSEQFILDGTLLRPLPLLILAAVVAWGRRDRTRRLLGPQRHAQRLGSARRSP